MSRRLLMLFLVALAVRLAYCGATSGFGKFRADRYQEYALMAARFQESATLTCPLILDDTTTTPSAMFPPVYALLLAGIYAVLGIDSFAAVVAAQILNALAMSLSAVMAFYLGRRLSSDRSGWVAAAVVTVNPLTIGYVTYLWDTCLFTLGVLLAVWLSVWLADHPPKILIWTAFGIFLGALAHLNPSLTLAYPLLVLWPLTRQAAKTASIFKGAMFALTGWMIAVTPWAIRNHAHFGEWMYVRGGLGLQLWLGACPEADVNGSVIFATHYPMQNDDVQSELVAVGERAFVKGCMTNAVEAITHDPWRWLGLVRARISDYWLGTILTHAYPGSGAWPGGTARLAVAWFLVAETILVLACVARRRSRPRPCRWLLGIVASFSVIYCLTHVELRYRTPCEPIMAVAIGLLLFPGSGRDASCVEPCEAK